MGQKPDDWRTVSLCRSCHTAQHQMGELTFWQAYGKGDDEAFLRLIEAFCKASPKAADIRRVRAERG